MALTTRLTLHHCPAFQILLPEKNTDRGRAPSLPFQSPPFLLLNEEGVPTQASLLSPLSVCLHSGLCALIVWDAVFQVLQTLGALWVNSANRN